MIKAFFATATAVTNAMAVLSASDRVLCRAEQVEGGYEVHAPDRLGGVLNGDHPTAPLPAAEGARTYKVDLYRRTTDKEAEAIEMALAAASVRDRRLFESATYLDHGAPEFAHIHDACVEMFGAKRADALLAASEA